MSTDDSTSDSVIAISITSLLVAVLFSTCGFLVGMMVQRAIYKYKGKMRLDSNAVLADDPLPTSVTHTSELTPVYEDILPPEKRKKIESSRKCCIWNWFLSQILKHLSVCS